jgi:hypothetical protein
VLILPSQTPATVASIANYKREMRDAFAPMAVVVSLKEILIWVAGTCSVISRILRSLPSVFTHS